MKSYPSPISVTVDAVIFTISDGTLKVLLVSRDEAPFKNKWSLPGGFIHSKETSLQAIKRILKAKAGIANIFTEQLYTFDDSNRDPRGHVITISYFAFVREDQIKFNKAKHPQSPTFFSVQKLPPMAFDHAKIVKYAIKRLQAKLEYTNIVYALLPKTFPFSQLQNIYEEVWNRKLDKRNFRKKFMSLKLIKPTRGLLEGSRQRPARLFQFINPNQQELKKFF